MKSYVFDDNVLISGANLNRDYFEDRQDRYILFKDSPKLAEYYQTLTESVGRFSHSYAMKAQPVILPPADGSFTDPTLAKGVMEDFLRRYTGQYNVSSLPEKTDTFIIPTIQMAPFGIRQDQKVLSQIFSTLKTLSAEGGPWKVDISSGYLNFPHSIMDMIWSSPCSFNVLTAAPEVPFRVYFGVLTLFEG